MIQKAVTLDLVFIEAATYRLKSIINSVEQRYSNYVFDPKREERIAKQECLSCFYDTHIAGAAMCERPCADCGTTIYSGSTRVPVLCIPCAKARGVCHDCAAELSMDFGKAVTGKRIVVKDKRKKKNH